MVTLLHIGFTGTQDGLTIPQRHALKNVLQAYRAGGSYFLHHGDCIGADAAAHLLWRELDGKIALHPPTDRKKRANCQTNSSGDIRFPPCDYLARNKDIVNESGVLIGCPGTMHEQIRSGTWSTIRYARKLNRPVVLVFPDGSTSHE